MNKENYISRRKFLGITGTAVVGIGLTGCNFFSNETQLNIYKSKAMGCFMGAAIADAMGGPVECKHYKYIAENFTDFQDLIRYDVPGNFLKIGNPAYALEATAGTTTDDTAIRMQLAAYVLDTNLPYTAEGFSNWLKENANFENWWEPAVKAIKRVWDGKVTIDESGKLHKQGGGGAWWQPISMIYAGDPQKASAVTSDMCRIWKAPLEQDILSSVVAGQAAAYKKGATIDSVVAAVMDDSGPLAKKLFQRTIDIASKASNPEELYYELYEHCLVKSCTTEIDGPMPERLAPVDNREEPFYNGILFAEQQPLALAYLVYGQGEPRKTILTAVKGGRDADSVASNTAAWLGALKGIEVWPDNWVQTVQQANLKRIDIMGTGQKLIDKGLAMQTVKLNLM